MSNDNDSAEPITRGTRVRTIDGRRRTIRAVLANGWYGLSDGTYLPATQFTTRG